MFYFHVLESGGGIIGEVTTSNSRQRFHAVKSMSLFAKLHKQLIVKCENELMPQYCNIFAYRSVYTILKVVARSTRTGCLRGSQVVGVVLLEHHRRFCLEHMSVSTCMFFPQKIH